MNVLEPKALSSHPASRPHFSYTPCPQLTFPLGNTRAEAALTLIPLLPPAGFLVAQPWPTTFLQKVLSTFPLLKPHVNSETAVSGPDAYLFTHVKNQGRKNTELGNDTPSGRKNTQRDASLLPPYMTQWQ